MKTHAIISIILLFFLMFSTENIYSQSTPPSVQFPPFQYWSNQISTHFTITIQAASVIRVVPNTVTLSLTPLVAGGPVVNDLNDDSYLRVTSILAGQNANKNVQANISMGSVPSGTVLKLAASPCTTGSGKFGTTSSIILSNTAQPIITGIGSCYTGDGPSEGYNLTYRWELASPNPVNLIAGTTAVSITYTISQW